MTFQPSYYQGRRVHVMRCTSHPATYVYTWVREGRYDVLGKFYPTQRLRLVRADAYWRSKTTGMLYSPPKN